MQLIIDLLNFLTPYGAYAYVLMFVILLACGFGLPLPEDVVLITGGMLASHQVTDHWVTLAVTMAGVLIGDGIVFTLGRRAGDSIKQTRLFKRIIKPGVDQKIQSWFSRYGDKVIFFARFTPGLRMALFLSAGIYRVPAWKFFALDGFAATISVPLWIWLGFVFGSNLELLESKVRQLQFGIYGVLGLLLVVLGLAWFIKRKVSSKIL